MLDPVQQARIEALHKGFLYQHLYAVGCLLLSRRVGARCVCVEKDEDIEIDFPGRTLYVQVKTRAQPLSAADVGSAFERFKELRDEHTNGRRTGVGRFLIVANKPPSRQLAERLRQKEGDVSYLWPEGQLGQPAEELPPAWNDLSEAVHWCVTEAGRLPYRMIAADSLVWKLTGQVVLAASGSTPYTNHAFVVESLPRLFEQLLVQLQDFPEPPQDYRPQTEEPALQSLDRLRIVTGFSGAGKTSWAAQAAIHSQDPCVYYDTGETPGPALAAALVREIAAKLLGGDGDEVRRVLMPGAVALESLSLLDRCLMERGTKPLVVIDNGHSLPAQNIVDILRNTRYLRILLLCQPTGSTAEIEALAGVRREDLRGWDVHEVAQEATAQQCHGDAEAMERLRVLCGGLPLYVQGACKVAASEHGGDIRDMCNSIDEGTHLAATPQEVILQRVFQSLTLDERQVLSVLSVSEVPLAKAEVEMLLKQFTGLTAQEAATTLRRLRSAGFVQVFGSRDVRVHDAIRLLGFQHLQRTGAPVIRSVRLHLKELVVRSLEQRGDASRFGFLTRILIALEDVEVLIELIGEEMFHEMGVTAEVVATLEGAVERGQLSPEQQFWGYDGLIFSALRGGEQARISEWLRRMEQLLDTHPFIGTQRLTFLLKRMMYQSAVGDVTAVRNSIETITQELPDDETHQLIFKYNAAASLFKVREYEPAVNGVQEVIGAYFRRLGITPADVVGASQQELWNSLDIQARTTEDIKHLADALELLAMIQRKTDTLVTFASIHAMKFYGLAGAYDSLIRAGQDAADDFVARRDYEGAREILEQHVFPSIRENGMVSKLLDATTQYAVILAYCGKVDDAEAQMVRVRGLLQGATPDMHAQVAKQADVIRHVRIFGPPG